MADPDRPRLERFSWERFDALPIVGILRRFGRDEILKAVEAASRGGITTVEVTLDTKDASGIIAALRERFEDSLEIGAGTIRTKADFEKAFEAGASFVVTPIVSAEVIHAARASRVPVFAGALTPTEIHTAFALGADIVKVFPANVFGPSYIRDLRGPLSDVRLMPTGGVTVDSVAAYRRAGACALGVGSPLFARERIEVGDFDWVEERARRFVAALAGS